MPKSFYTPFKNCLPFLTHNVQSLFNFLKIALFFSLISLLSLMMDIGAEVNQTNCEDVDTIAKVSHINDEARNISNEANQIEDKILIQIKSEEKDRYIEYSFDQNTNKKGNDMKNPLMKKPKEPVKHKKISSTNNKQTHQRKYFWPPNPPKRKVAPTVSIHMSNPQAQIVLEERKVEIKDLESQVVYLQKQIKELKIENRTLLEVQNRQSKELKKYCGGITDLPALIRSHNDEIKSVQFNANAVRKELRMCQADLKSKNELLLKKDHALNKLKLALKSSEQNIHESTVENSKLNQENKKLEDETKKLQIENEEVKSQTEIMQKTIQQLTNKEVDLEETLSAVEHIKQQLEDDLKELQKKHTEALKKEITFKKFLEAQKMSSTQTDKVETVDAAIMTQENFKETCLVPSGKVSIGVQTSQDKIFLLSMPTELRGKVENEDNVGEKSYHHSTASKDQFTALDVYPDIFYNKESTNSKPPSQIRKTGIRKSLSSLSQEVSNEIFEVKKSYRDLTPLPAFEMLKKPPDSEFDKKYIPLSNNLHYNTATFCSKAPFSESINTSLGFNTGKDDNNFSFHFKESAFKDNSFKKLTEQMESSLENNLVRRKDIQNDIAENIFDPVCETSLKPSNNSYKGHNDLFSKFTSKRNAMYPNG